MVRVTSESVLPRNSIIADSESDIYIASETLDFKVSTQIPTLSAEINQEGHLAVAQTVNLTLYESLHTFNVTD